MEHTYILKNLVIGTAGFLELEGPLGDYLIQSTHFTDKEFYRGRKSDLICPKSHRHLVAELREKLKPLES